MDMAVRSLWRKESSVADWSNSERHVRCALPFEERQLNWSIDFPTDGEANKSGEGKEELEKRSFRSWAMGSDLVSMLNNRW